jgi:far upstream element-binding protein
MSSLAADVSQDSTSIVEDTTSAPVADNTWAENNDSEEDDDDEDVAPGRENKKRSRPESVITDGQNKSSKTSSDETDDGDENDIEEGATITQTISIPSNLAGCVIGRGGTVIKATREQSGANVNVSKEEVSPGLREVTLTGQAHEVAAARTMVEAQVEAKKQQNEESGENNGPPPGTITTIIQVPNAKVGGLIGKGGSSINEIRNRSGCRINIQDSKHNNRDKRDVTIIGTLSQTQEAQTLIQKKLTEIIPRENNGNQLNHGGHGGMYNGQGGYGPPPGYGGMPGYGGRMPQAWGGQNNGTITTQVSVPDDSVGRLIGRGGETINRIRQMSQCRIDIAKSDAQSQSNGLRIITLTGTEQTIKLAQDMLRQKLAEAQQQQQQYANQSIGVQGGVGQGGSRGGGQGQSVEANPWGPIGTGQQQGYAMGGFGGGGGYGMMPNGQPSYGQQYGGQGGGLGSGNPY